MLVIHVGYQVIYPKNQTLQSIFQLAVHGEQMTR